MRQASPRRKWGHPKPGITLFLLVTASPLHKVFQLADIARPLVVEEQRFGFFGKRQLAMVLAAVKPQEHAVRGAECPPGGRATAEWAITATLSR